MGPSVVTFPEARWDALLPTQLLACTCHRPDSDTLVHDRDPPLISAFQNLPLTREPRLQLHGVNVVVISLLKKRWETGQTHNCSITVQAEV